MTLARSSSFALSIVALVALAGFSGCGGARASKPPRVAAATAPKQEAPSFGPAQIDAMLRDAWKAGGVTPAARVDDATFLRRVTIDIVGTVPTPDDVTKFVADPSPDKRAKLVDALLASPGYAHHWMNYWDDVLMGRDARGNLVDRLAFRRWLRTRFEENAPWDRVVRDLVSATGQNSGGGRKGGPGLAADVPMAMSASQESERDADDAGPDVNGAVNWTLRFEQAPQDLAGSASRTFLGVQIQCAQCHDHKTEKWKQDDFRRFASAFLHAKIVPVDPGKPMGIRRVDLADAVRVAPRFAKNADTAPIAAAKPTALDGTDLAKGDGTRKALAVWMTSKNNPWFAKAFVNRMWGHFLGRGFYDPVDDIRPSNPATMPELLDRMAADFADHDFDVKRLVRTICATEAYQLAAAPPAAADAKGPDPENKTWARFHLAPLGPEELLNAIFRVTNVEAVAEKAGIKNLDQLRAQIVRQYAFLFDVDETDDVPDFSGTVSQALVLLNGALVAQGARAIPGSALADVLATPGDDAAKIDQLALRVLSRKPTDEERAKWVGYVQSATKPAPPTIGAPAVLGAKVGRKKPGGGPLDRLANRGAGGDPKRLAYEDLFWAMLSSSEFVFNH